MPTEYPGQEKDDPKPMKSFVVPTISPTETVELTGDQALGAFETKLGAKLVGFDPAIIITIIDAIVGLLKGCTAKTTQDACQRRGPLVRHRIRRALRTETTIDPFSNDGKQVMEAVLDCGCQASEPELRAMIEKVAQ